MDKMWEMLPLIAMFLVVPVVIKLLSENKTRRKLIEKGLVDENIKYLFPDKPKDYVSSSLKWGMVLIAMGLAVFAGQMAPRNLMEEVTIGCMLILGGLALVLYYIIANKKLNKSKEENPAMQVR
ncbi:MAG: hypothetical protein MUO91_07525 [candidate division Zixibacteria bacterium]|nr:hypothetical protein [candidate division Zixibacteria bacterium]